MALLGKGWSEERLIKTRLRMKGNQFAKGFKHREETKRKVSLAGMGRKHSEESKRKIGLGNKGKIVSNETRNKLSLAKKGKPNYKLRGRKMSEEQKKAVGDFHRGKVISEEQKQKQREFMKGNKLWKKRSKGFKHSEETKKKLSLMKIGNPSRSGMKNSEEMKRKIGMAHKGKFICEETRKKMRLNLIKSRECQFNNGLPIHPRIGNNETEILDQIEFEFNTQLERQFRVAGYFVDGYDKKNNIIFEVDEGYHLSNGQIVKDKVREENIINELNCEVIRIKDY